MFNLAEYRNKPQNLADFLPWAALVAEGIVLNKDGSFQRTTRSAGPILTAQRRPNSSASLRASTTRFAGFARAGQFLSKRAAIPRRTIRQARFPIRCRRW